MDVPGFLELLGLRILTIQRNIVEYFKVICRFYGNREFRHWDLALLSRYLFRNPYKICRRYFQSIGADDPYGYGETPLTSLQLMAQEFGLQKEDVVYEMGSGRGRGCFWMRAFIQCRVVGIEIVPFFVQKAQKVKERFRIEGLEFRQADMADVDYHDATVIYLYGTCFEDLYIEQLVDKLARLPEGTKIITVSYALTEYMRKPLFELVKTIPVKFAWGEADVYLQVRKG